jgi:hypothetical protein
MFRNRFLMALMPLMAAIGMNGFNFDVPYIIAGPDEILRPDLYVFLDWLIVILSLLLLLFSFLYYKNIWFVAISCISFAIFVFWLFLSVLILGIDTGDSYLHIKEERIVFHTICASYFFLLIVFGCLLRKREKVNEA